MAGKITNMLTNRLLNPLGFTFGEQPRLSWITEAEGKTQKTARIEVSLSDSFDSLCHDSGARGDIDSICYPLEIKLAPRTRYYWRVMVETDLGERIQSAAAWFETAKLNEVWTAQWITPNFDPDWHPVLFTEYEIVKPVKRARAYVCGLGLYELRLNGEKAGDECLSPGLVAYDLWLPYQTYDVTAQLFAGMNKAELFLGNGWYKGRYGLGKTDQRYGHEFAAICELFLEYEDGTSAVIATGPDWRARRHAVTESSIFDGEVRDDTLGCSAVYPVRPARIKAPLEARRSPSVKIMHQLRPVEVIHTPAGETVLDMGQNMVGWLAFENKAPKGAEIHLQFGEVLQGGNFYRDNLRKAKAEFRYISDGEAKTVHARFTFFGFRFVKLTKWHGGVNPDDFTGLVLYSDMHETGRLETSNPKVNRLIQNTLWGQRGNFLDVPTDCPQRDERMGWTGDAQVFFGTAAFNMDVYAFFTKYCHDLMLEQEKNGGSVPVVIPQNDVAQLGACAWGDAATIIPWQMYVRYGDKEILRRQFSSMKAWVDYIRRRDAETGDSRLWKGDFHYGDWLSLDGEEPIKNRFGGTERTYLASCFYRYSSMLTAKAARVLGYNAEAEEYERLSGEVRAAILREYVTETGRLAVNTQTAYVLALHFDIMPEKWRAQAARALRLKLKESAFHLRTGFIGTPYLCRVLSETGANDISYRLLLQEDFPSWLYQVNMGATTIWERWNSILPDGSISDTGMNSLNHYSYGSVVEWIYRDAAGIVPLEEAPGFRRFRLAPRPHYLLGHVEAEYLSPAGLVKSAWKLLADGNLELRFTVPFGASAELRLPFRDEDYPKELPAGEHVFTYRPAQPMRPVYDADTPVSALLANPAVAEVLWAEFPALVSMMLFPMMAGERSLRDFAEEGFFALTPELEKQLREKFERAAGH